MVVLFTESTQPMFTHDLIVVHLRDVFIGTFGTIGAQSGWFKRVEHGTNWPIRVETKVVFLLEEPFELERLIMCIWMDDGIQSEHD